MSRGRAPAAVLTALGFACWLAVSGCLDIDALKTRAAQDDADGGGRSGAPGGCESADRRVVRFWKLHLGQSDYVTLRNTGECAVELSGLRLFFDDLDELLPNRMGDCEIQLPAFRLGPGVEVRVHEDPLPGDISFLDNKLEECRGDFSYNPERGGVSYLCDGSCRPEAVIDVVAHAGETYITPPVRFGQTFDALLEGVTVAEQNSKHFRRVKVEGEAPNFLSSDWQLERRYVYAGFEDAVDVEVNGVRTSWKQVEGSQTGVFSAAEIAAVGDVALSMVHRGSDGRSDALSLEFPAGEGAPVNVSFFIRAEERDASAAYVDFEGGGGDFSAVRASIEPSGVGVEVENGKRTEILGEEGTWFQVELRNMDWSAHRYDLYIDRILVAPQTRFWANIPAAEKLSLYSVTGGATARWDEIELWRDDVPARLPGQ